MNIASPPIDDALDGVVQARQLPLALRQHLERALAEGGVAAAQAGIAVFEAVWHMLPPFDDARVADAAAALYRRLDLGGAAALMSGLAAQMRRIDPRPQDCPAGLATAARAIVTAPDSGAAMLHAVERLQKAADWAAAAALFEAVWPHVAPMLEYWGYHHMAGIYARLDQPRLAALVSGVAIQMEPVHRASDLPHRLLLAWLRGQGQIRAAALLSSRRAATCPDPALLPAGEMAALLEAAGPLPAPLPPAGLRHIPVVAADIRPAAPWRCYGGMPASISQLQHDLGREAIHVTELADAEVLLDRGAVAVFGPDGTPHIELSLRDYPSQVRRRLDAYRTAGGAVEELSIEAAVLTGDIFPTPNLCHFMLDQASRMALYRMAGVNPAAVTVIGPSISAEYQREVGQRVGMRATVSTLRRARLRVGRLWVSSNCRHMMHPAHWGSGWAVQEVRRAFDLTPRAPARRLLISRADAPRRRIANEAEMERVLAPYGFETIVPGQMAFLDQVAAFRDASHVAGPHGAGLANILFCAPGTQVLEVFPPLYGTWAYAMIAPTLGLEYASMLARDGESDDPVYNDPSLPQTRRNQHADRHMRVDLDELRRWLTESGA